MVIRCPDPNARWSRRYQYDLTFREAWDDADKKTRSFTSLWNAGEFAIPELPVDADDLNDSDYY